MLQSRLDAEQKFDVNSTPTLIVNGKKVTGSHDIDTLGKAIEAAG